MAVALRDGTGVANINDPWNPAALSGLVSTDAIAGYAANDWGTHAQIIPQETDLDLEVEEDDGNNDLHLKCWSLNGTAVGFDEDVENDGGGDGGVWFGAFTGVDKTVGTNTNGVRNVAINSGTTGSATAPSITANDGDMLLTLWFPWWNNTSGRSITAYTWSANGPTGTEDFQGQSGDYGIIAATYQAITTTGATGTRVATTNSTPADWKVVSIALAAAATGGTVDVGALTKTPTLGNLQINAGLLLGSNIKTPVIGQPQINATVAIDSLIKSPVLGNLFLSGQIGLGSFILSAILGNPVVVAQIIDMGGLTKTPTLGSLVITGGPVNLSGLVKVPVLGSPQLNYQLDVSSLVKSATLGQPVLTGVVDAGGLTVVPTIADPSIFATTVDLGSLIAIPIIGQLGLAGFQIITLEFTEDLQLIETFEEGTSVPWPNQTPEGGSGHFNPWATRFGPSGRRMR